MSAGTEAWSKKDFISSLKRYREEKGLTQTQLGEQLGVAKETIRRWESAKDKTLPTMHDVPAIAKSLGMTIDELITGIPTRAVNIHRATGLSPQAIETLQDMRKSYFLRVVNALLSPDQYYEASLQMKEIVEMKKSLFSGEAAEDFRRTQNIIRGIQAEMTGEYSRLLQRHTSTLAKKELENEGKSCLEEWKRRGYSPLSDDEIEAIFNEQDESPLSDDEIEAMFDEKGGE